jgi:hypothetical protein
MKRLLFLFPFLLLFTVVSIAQESKYNGVGRWRTHFPYKDVKQIQEAGNFIFVLPEKGFFTYHKPSGEINVFSKINGFSDIDVSVMRYIESLNKIVFVYASGNIDILDLSTNNIQNIPDILRKSILGEKVFYDLQYFDNKAFLSTSFGIIVIDINKLEISDSYQNIGPGGNVVPIYSSVRYKDYIYAGTNQGILRANAVGKNLSDFQNWEKIKSSSESKLLRVFNNKLYAVHDSIYQFYDDNTWKNVRGDVKRNVMTLEICGKKLIETHWGGFLISSLDESIDSVRENEVYCGIIDANEIIWTGGAGLGFFNINLKKNQEHGFFGINGPNALTTHTIVGVGDDVWVTGGGPNFTFGPTFNGNGYYHFTNNIWKNRPDLPLIQREMFDFTAIAIDKSNGDVFLGSHGTGIAQLRNGLFINRFESTNSSLRKQANLFTIVPGLGFDSKGNLWASNFDTDSCLSRRTPNNLWTSFKLSTRFAGEMAIDELDQKWMTTPRYGNGLIVFKEASNGQPQRDRQLSKGKGSGDLPSSRVNALLVDKDNEVWIGTDEGLAVFFNPARAFDLQEDAQRIIVDQNGVVGYLLGSETINDMCIDGANRKWVATNNGAFLVEKDGTGVLSHFTIENSPLPSNVIKSVGVNGTTGEVFFGTENGLISYGGNATDATDNHSEEIKIYPNPVYENYDGDITIQGLPDYATVKITDVSGRLIYETLSNGGIATWNGKMFNGKRPKTGIYLIFSSNKEDRDSKVNKLFIVN